MKKKSLLTVFLSFLGILLVSFQCEKPYKDNHVIQIDGQFVDTTGAPLPYFEFILTHRDIYSEQSYVPKSSDKIITTNQDGKFQFLSPEIQQTRSRIPALAFVDTTWNYNVELLYDSVVFRPFVPFYMNNNTETQISLGTIIVKQ
jgi:hypothetical protein